MPGPPWPELWERIEARVAYDPCFWVQGYERAQVMDAIGEMKRLFPAEWVQARYQVQLDMGLAHSVLKPAESEEKPAE